jgi:glycosyltransferase involved in cell wall biosynthesis
MVGNSIEVIIPVRNMADHLPKVLQPLLAQLADGDRISVVDDASTDDTEAVARSLGANVVSLTASQGPYYARQVVASRSSADILLFVDGRSRPRPGLLDAHRALQANDGVALSCTHVRTLSGSTLAGRIAPLADNFSIPRMGAVPGKPGYFPTANLGVDRTAFEKVGGFRKMRSGGDADICWRIQEQSLGTMAVHPDVLMDWEPRTTLRELLSQFKRYGRGTVYLRWAYRIDAGVGGGSSPSRRTLSESWRMTKAGLPRTPLEFMALLVTGAMFQFGYWSEKLGRTEYLAPVHYDLGAADSSSAHTG